MMNREVEEKIEKEICVEVCLWYNRQTAPKAEFSQPPTHRQQQID